MLTGYKLNTGGNDFIFVEDLELPLKTITQMSDRKFGIGCDQFFVYKVDGANLLVKIFNSDGSLAKNCGNGMLACGSLMSYLHGLKNFAVDTHFIKMNIDIDEDVSRLTLPMPLIKGDFVDVGNTHMVVLCDDFNINESFSNEYNKNYIKIISDDEIEVSTIERGCGYTASCGSGNVSSAFFAYSNKCVKSNVVKVKNKYENYIVEILDNKVILTGKSKLVAKFSYFTN